MDERRRGFEVKENAGSGKDNPEERKLSWLEKRTVRMMLKKSKKLHKREMMKSTDVNKTKKKLVKAILELGEFFSIEDDDGNDMAVSQIEGLSVDELSLLLMQVIDEIQKLV